MSNMVVVLSTETASAEREALGSSVREALTESSQTGVLDSPEGLNTSDSAKDTSILIVEDEEGVRDLLEHLLFLEGYRTTAVDNGDEGVSRFRKELYDLVFTDFRMPGMSGADVAKAIKALSSRTPVIIVTGWDPEAMADELKNSGVDRVLKKPFDMNEVLDLVSELTHDP